MARMGDLASLDDYGPDELLAPPLDPRLAAIPSWLKHGLVSGAAEAMHLGSQVPPTDYGDAIPVTAEEAQAELERLTGPAPRPAGFLGRAASEAVRMGTNPLSWVGPGSIPYKAGFTGLSGLGSEAGGHLAEGTPYEKAARFAGGMGPSVVERAIPAAGQIAGAVARLPGQIDRMVPQGSIGAFGGKMVIPTQSERVPGAGIESARKVNPSREQLMADPAYAYHGTNIERAYDILEAKKLRTYGPSHGTPDQFAWPDLSREKRSYWTSNPETVKSFYPEEGAPALMRARRDAVPFRTESGTRDLYTTKPVPEKYLEIYLGDGKWGRLAIGGGTLGALATQDQYQP
jgi:hypothetical protein